MLGVLIVTTVLIGLAHGEACVQDDCNLPDCRCFSDTAIPGGLEAVDIPQLVVISMDYALNSELDELYRSIFTDTNPNDCPVRGTFFIQDLNTDYTLVKSLYDDGFEIGINSLTGTTPSGSTGWSDEMKAIKDKLIGEGLDAANIVGYRAPGLQPGGSNMFMGIADQDMLYDASCVSSEFSTVDNLKFPFTYDYDWDNGQVRCNSGSAVDLAFAGKWQVLMGQLEFQGAICASPQGCTNVVNQQDAFDILYQNFQKHYEGSRSPFTVVVDPLWMETEFKREGLKEFVGFIRAAFDDVWVVTQHQAIQWVQNPTLNADLGDFGPFQCTP